MKLDPIDLKILDAIQRDGRITKLALAEKVGLSPTPCWMRLRKLEQAGIINGYHARIAIRMLAPITTVLMEVTLRNHRQADFDRFERAVRVVMDPDLGRYKTVCAAAGLPTPVFEVPPATLRILANATVAPITEERRQADIEAEAASTGA